MISFAGLFDQPQHDELKGFYGSWDTAFINFKLTSKNLIDCGQRISCAARAPTRIAGLALFKASLYRWFTITNRIVTHAATFGQPQAKCCAFCLVNFSHRLIVTSTYLGSISMRHACRPVRSAANKVEPLPPNGSKIVSPRFEQSISASAILWTGFTVGCMANSLSLPPLWDYRVIGLWGYRLSGMSDGGFGFFGWFAQR